MEKLKKINIGNLQKPYVLEQKSMVFIGKRCQNLYIRSRHAYWGPDKTFEPGLARVSVQTSGIPYSLSERDLSI